MSKKRVISRLVWEKPSWEQPGARSDAICLLAAQSAPDHSSLGDTRERIPTSSERQEAIKIQH